MSASATWISPALPELVPAPPAAPAPKAARYPLSMSASNGCLFVLCSDGAVFYRNTGTDRWFTLPPVPGTPAAVGA